MKLIYKLVKRAERAALQRAAQLLIRDDIYDEMFFAMLQGELGLPGHTNILETGADFMFIRKSAPVRKEILTVTENGGVNNG